ncbi:hypothetical protein [Sediminibacillus massiliensis]|uniref:hypothetical protein n=1 Tax=Sediminibacillus massiliensis TaxID=1926277 RepID=UPI0009885BD8|nr:hypothetical protein [Sediminibacillus massiliensis]
MILRWTRLRLILLAGCLLIVPLAFISGWQYYVSPLKSEAEQVVVSLKSVQTSTKGSGAAEQKDDSVENFRMLPADRKTDEVLTMLWEIESGTKSTIENISSIEDHDYFLEELNGPDLSGLKSLSYRIDVTASDYKAMTSFLKKVEERERLINIERIQFGDTTEENLNFSIIFRTFYNENFLPLSNLSTDPS